MSLLCGVQLILAREDLQGPEIQFCVPPVWPNAHNSIKKAQFLRHTILCHRELVYSTVSLDPVYSPLRDNFHRDGVNCQQGTTESTQAHSWRRHKGPSTIHAETPCVIKLWEKRVKTTQKILNSWIYGHIIFWTCASVCKCTHGQTQ